MTALDAQLAQTRLCRVVNVASGTLLDAAVTNSSNEHVVIGSPEEVAVIKAWRLSPVGPGWALEAVQPDPNAPPRYLAPGGFFTDTTTISKFPSVWDLERTEGLNYDSDKFARPKGMEEEWICVIRWPFGLGSFGGRVLDLDSYGSKNPGTKVRFQRFREPPRRQPCQYWRLQFIPSTESTPFTSSPPPYGANRTPEAHTKVVTTVETTIVTNTNVLPPSGKATTKSHTSKTSTTSTAYFRPDGSVENEISSV